MTKRADIIVIPDDYSERIRTLRGRIGMTQKVLAAELSVSFATVNRWENKQSKPSPLSWKQIEKLYQQESTEDQDDTVESKPKKKS